MPYYNILFNLICFIMNLEEAKSKSVSCIYRIKFPDGKYYVGQTQSLRSRIRLYERLLSDDSSNGRVMCAMREFGIESTEWEILSCVSVRDKDDLKLCLSILEIKYIRENDCIYPNGYNTSIGGEILGIPADVIETTFGVVSTGFAGKPILVYDIDGIFVEEYATIARCAYALGVMDSDVSSVVGKMLLLRDTYMIREKKYGEVPQKILPFQPKTVVKKVVETEVEKIYVKRHLDNASIMYDEFGEYVGLFENAHQARKYMKADFKFPYGREFRGYYLFHYNGGEIKKSLGVFTSKTLTTCMYDDILALGDVENIGDLISLKVGEEHVSTTKKIARRVNKYTLEGEYLETYDDIVSAAKDNNLLDGCVRACCNRKTRTSGGFVFRFEDDKEPVLMSMPKKVSNAEKRTYCKSYVIEQYSLQGDLLNTYNTMVEASEVTGISVSAIFYCVSGKTKKSGGYLWKKRSL